MRALLLLLIALSCSGQISLDGPVAGAFSRQISGGGGDVTSGLISRWKFDEGSGTTAADSVGGNNGSSSGTIHWGAGIVNGGISQILTDPAIICGSSSIYQGSAITVSFWAQMNDTSIVKMVFGDLTGATRFCLEFDSNIYFDFGDIGAGGRVNCSTPANASMGWHFWTFTAGGGAMAIYEDTVSLASTAASGTYTASGNFYICNCDGYDHPWIGTLDDLRIYNRVLSGSEITQLYNFR